MARNMFSQSQNPVLNEKMMREKGLQYAGDGVRTFTMTSAINKTFFLMAILLLTSVVGYMFPSPILTWGGAIGGLIVVIITVRNIEKSGTYAPIYAALEGLFVGGVSAMYANFGAETMGSGIILQAVSLTIMVVLMMLIVHKSGIIPVTNKFRTGVVMATGAIFLIYMMTIVLGFFGVRIPYIHEGGTFGILFSVAVLGIASLNLLLDFDLFKKGEEFNAPEYMEWFAGMSLLITIVWIYIEMLNLLTKLRN
jgi:uncharacterized YccA/Bax inhibitor family protein